MTTGTPLTAGTPLTTGTPQLAARTHGGFHRLRVAAVDRLTADAVALTFAVPADLRDAFTFAAGQHLTLRAVLGGEEVRRSYSICSAPSSGRLRVAVKRLEGGVFSGHALTGVAVGDEVEVMCPAGRFGVRLDPGAATHYAAIVAGSGITPVISILAAVLETEPASRFTLVYGNRDAASVMFLDELADLKDRHPRRLQLVHVLSREAQDADLLTGRIDAAKLDALLTSVVPPDVVDEWLLCGPFALVEQARAALAERGVPPRRVHLELFHVEGSPVPVRPPATAHPDADSAEVTVRLDGRTTTFAMPPDGSVLEATLAVRADAPYACKGGVCGTCRARVVAGAVTMARHYALDDDELDDGFVLACQSVPTTPTLTLDFDA